MKFAVASLLMVAAFATGSNAISCWNATAMPDMEEMMFMLILGGSVSDYDPVLTMPADAEVHTDCDACARFQVRMEIDTASFHADEPTTTTTASADGWNFNIPDVKFNFSLVHWECVKTDPEEKKKEAENAFLTALGIAMLLEQIPGANESALLGSHVEELANDHASNMMDMADDDEECAQFELKMAKGEAVIAACQCCDDWCHFHSDCGARYHFGSLIPDIHDDTLEDVSDKCKFLRHAAYVMGEVCDYVDTYSGLFTMDSNSTETEDHDGEHHMKKRK